MKKNNQISMVVFDWAGTAELDVLKDMTTKKYLEAGADMVIDNITELPMAIEKINQMMANEE